jgi:hypothetical protein
MFEMGRSVARGKDRVSRVAQAFYIADGFSLVLPWVFCFSCPLLISGIITKTLSIRQGARFVMSCTPRLSQPKLSFMSPFLAESASLLRL